MSQHFQRASFKPATFDEKSNTVQVIWATQNPYTRRDAKGNFDEVLSLDPAHVDLSRLKGASVLNSHQQSDLKDIIGVVESVELKDGLGLATVKFSTRADVTPFVEDVRNGVIRFLSVGYSVQRFEEETVNGKRVKRAVAWTPHEISFTPVPADAAAQVKSYTAERVEMDHLQTTNPPDTNVIAHRAAVRDIAKRSGLSSDWADTQIDSGADIASVKASAHDAMIARSTPIIVRQVGTSGEDPAVVLQRRVDGLHSHTTGEAPKPEARVYAHDNLSDHLRSMLMDRGVNTRGISKQELFTRAAMHTTSDFAALLQGVGNRSLLPAYQASRSPLIKVFRKQSRTDFRASYDLRIGELSELKKVTEAGEIKSVGRSELSQSYLMDTYAGMFNLSRKALINDDLGAFADSARAFGQAAATTESNLMVALLQSNPVMAEDNKALFHADHSNLGAASTVDADGLSAARLALRKMKGLDGKTPISVTPAFLIIPAERETESEQMLAAIDAAQSGDVNVFTGKLELLVDSRLAASPWYVAASPSQVPCLSYAVLNGGEVPKVEVNNLWDVLGTSVRAYHDFGVGAQDFRGLFKNPGA